MAALTQLYRAAALAVMAVVAAPPAHTAPFEHYQLITWQEHTPAETAALAKLGFTGTKLRATDGQVDPAELAAHLASGLPFYLENIATDLFSTYHRYTPGKSVTWRFDEAKARLRANPADTKVFIRDPSLADPVVLARLAERLRALVAEVGKYHPLFYNLADEAGIGDLSAAWDADIGPASLAGFRDWLQLQYPNLAALNAEWDTSYDRWDEVQPELTDAALARTDANYAAWSDFKGWMDVSFARAVRAGTDALHSADATAIAGLEGGQVPGWGGYDYARLAPAVDLMEIYDTGNAAALAMAANPKLILLRTSFGAGDEAEAWRNLLEGGRGTIVWDEGGHSVVAADGTPTPRGTALAALVRDLRAVAPALFATSPDPDPVGVLVSQESFRVQWLLDRRAAGPAWTARDSARENEDNDWRAARRETLQRLHGIGIEPVLLSSAQLAAGAAATDKLRAVFLPHAIALSDAEVAALSAFAAAGGTVLAGTEPGLFDGHGKRRPKAPLAGIAQVPEALLRTGTLPSAGVLDATAALLAKAGITPRLELRLPDGSRATGLEARWRRDAAREIVSLQTISPPLAPPPFTLILRGKRMVTDLRAPSPPLQTDRVPIAIDRVVPTLLSLAPGK